MKRTLILLVLVILLAIPAPALAQSQNPPVDPNSAWGEVVDSNGNIRYSNLTDLGPVQKSASWMPGIPRDRKHPGLIPRIPDPQRKYRRHADRHHPVLHGAQPPGLRDGTGQLAAGCGCSRDARSRRHYQRNAAGLHRPDRPRPSDVHERVCRPKPVLQRRHQQRSAGALVAVGEHTQQDFFFEFSKSVSRRKEPLHHAAALHPGPVLRGPGRLPGQCQPAGSSRPRRPQGARLFLQQPDRQESARSPSRPARSPRPTRSWSARTTPGAAWT